MLKNTLHLNSLEYSPRMGHSSQLFDMAVHPGKILRQKMEEKGWTQDELAAITGLSRQTIYFIVKGKSNITPETAARLAAAFGNPPEEWVKWDGLFRLANIEHNREIGQVSRLAHLYSLAPIKELQKRGWISEEVLDAESLEKELKKFFGTDSLDGDLTFPVATRRSLHTLKLNSAEKAWCFQARRLATKLPLPIGFNPRLLDHAERKLRQLAAYRKLAGHVHEVLAEYGIRLVVVEPIPNVRIDGATFWLDTEPVIAMSLRHDRIDGFWFTLMHEFAHVRNGDGSVDSDLIDGTKGIATMLVDDETERVANEMAAASLIKPNEMQSFIARVGPLYARERVIQFAHKQKIHPGIVVGQLQRKNEIGYSALRDLLVKVRDLVVAVAFTDGWGQSVSPAIM
jgi:HTH-type transcriptional regulator / antitoxin HigA